jgi:hypothetical protein
MSPRDEKAPLGRLARILLEHSQVDLLFFRYRNAFYLLANFDLGPILWGCSVLPVQMRNEALDAPATLMGLGDDSSLSQVLARVRESYWFSFLRFDVEDHWFQDDERNPKNWTLIHEGGPRLRLFDVERSNTASELARRQLAKDGTVFTQLGGWGFSRLLSHAAVSDTHPSLRDVTYGFFKRTWVDHKGVWREADESSPRLQELSNKLVLLDDPVLAYEDGQVVLSLQLKRTEPLSKTMQGFYLYLIGKISFKLIDALLVRGLSQESVFPLCEEFDWQDSYPENEFFQSLFWASSEGAIFDDIDHREPCLAHRWVKPSKLKVTIQSEFFDESYGRNIPNPVEKYHETFESWSEVDPSKVDFGKYFARLRR